MSKVRPLKAVVRNTAFNAAAAMLDRGSMVALTALLSSALPAPAFREFGQFQLTLTMLAAFSGIGISISAARIFAEHAAGRPANMTLVGAMWILSLLAALVLGGSAMLIGVATGPGVASAHAIPDSLLLLGVIILAGGIVANGGVLGLSLFRQSVGIAAIAAAMVIGGGWLAARQGSAVIAAWALVLAYALTTLLSSALVLRNVRWQEVFTHPLLSTVRLKGVVELVGPLAGVTLLAASGNWILGQILLWRSPSPFAFSGYIIGLQWYALVQFLPSMLTRAVFPVLVGRKGAAGTGNVLFVSAAAAVGIALSTGIAIAAASPLVATLYDGKAVSGGGVLVAFAFAAIPQSAANLLGNAIIVHGRQRAWLILTVLWFASLNGCALFFAEWNAMGAAASLFFSGLLLTLASVGYARRHHIL